MRCWRETLIQSPRSTSRSWSPQRKWAVDVTSGGFVRRSPNPRSMLYCVQALQTMVSRNETGLARRVESPPGWDFGTGHAHQSGQPSDCRVDTIVLMRLWPFLGGPRGVSGQ